MTLLHWEESWHDWEHAARSARTLDPMVKYSFFAALHALPDIVRAFPAVVAGEVVCSLPEWNVTEIAPLSSPKLSQIVLN